MGEHYLDAVGVSGSSPLAPIFLVRHTESRRTPSKTYHSRLRCTGIPHSSPSLRGREGGNSIFDREIEGVGRTDVPTDIIEDEDAEDQDESFRSEAFLPDG